MSVDLVASTVHGRVATFLAREAELADRHQYDDWLRLWSPDGVYWVPSNDDDYDPAEHVSIIYDDYDRLQERCFRLSVGGAHSQEPASRLCRVVGNVQLLSGEDAAGKGRVQVAATMVLVELRAGLKNVYAARLEYQLVDTGDSFLIARKKVQLLDNDEPLGNLTFLL